jgi:hypothetical protein
MSTDSSALAALHQPCKTSPLRFVASITCPRPEIESVVVETAPQSRAEALGALAGLALRNCRRRALPVDVRRAAAKRPLQSGCAVISSLLRRLAQVRQGVSLRRTGVHASAVNSVRLKSRNPLTQPRPAPRSRGAPTACHQRLAGGTGYLSASQALAPD